MWLNFRKTIWIVAGFICGNFVYQLLSSNPDYLKATERAFFQIITYVVILFSLWYNKDKK